MRFVTAADLVNNLVAAQARNTLAGRIYAWTAADLLLIDELGYLSFDARAVGPAIAAAKRAISSVSDP